MIPSFKPKHGFEISMVEMGPKETVAFLITQILTLQTFAVFFWIFNFMFSGLLASCMLLYLMLYTQVWPFPLYKCTGVQVYRCTGVQVYRCTGVHVYTCTHVHMYHQASTIVIGINIDDLFNFPLKKALIRNQFN